MTSSASSPPTLAPLFSAPGPWLHCLTRADRFDRAAAAKIIAHHFEILPEALEHFLAAVATCNEWLIDPANLSSEKRGVMQWAWGMEPSASLGNATRHAIGILFLPLILTDMLLHVSDPNPAPLMPRAPSRVVTLSQHFGSKSKSDWTSLLCRSHSCYIKNAERLSQTSTTRVAAKKADLLGFWRDLRLANPLLTVIRNLTHVSLVLSLYLLGDMNLSMDGRKEYLLLTASSLGVTLTEAEAETAVADTDVTLMVAPVFVAVAHSPLALLAPTAYAAAQFTTRVTLLDIWRALGNIHRVDLSDPLGKLESILWRLIFRLARKDITEVQLLKFFYDDAFVGETVTLLNNGTPLPTLGHGLKYASDLLNDAVETIDLIDPTEESDDRHDDTVQVAPSVVKKETSAQRPPRKKRKTDSGAAVQVSEGSGSRTLRPRSGPSGPPAQAATPSAPSTTASKTKATKRLSTVPPTPSATAAKTKATKQLSKKSSTRVESATKDSDKGSGKDVASPLSYVNLRSLAVLDGWGLPLPREADSLLRTCENYDRVLDPTLLYDVASEEFTVEIEYWVFSPAPADASEPLIATSHKYRYRPFHETRSDAEYLRKIVASQPLKRCETSNRDLPLHVHPDAQRFRRSGGFVSDTGVPLLPDVIPSPTESIVYVVHEDNWKSLTALQHQEVLRSRAVLVVHRNPYQHDGKTLQFDEQSLEAFTHLDRPAFFQDLGARRSGKDVDLQVGRVRDLLFCSRQRVESETTCAATTKDVDDALPNEMNEANDAPPTQRLNLLGNTLQSTSLGMPLGWTDLATHEYACTWLEHLQHVPAYIFPWSEVTWTIAANAHAVTWIHTDVLFTVVDIPVGEKLWFLASRRADLPPDDFRGIMRSRAAFDTFNGWTDMTSVWHFEQVHLSPYTTLYMPATFPHAVISMTDCIGAGRHGIPISNLSHCVYVSLHNTVLAKSTTNADHEPARRFLVRIFIFTMLAFMEPRDGSGGRGRDGGGPRLAARTRAHIPDLSTNNGVLDLLALRSFVVLVVAINGSGYAYSMDNAQTLLPLETEAARELSLAWKLAHNVIDYVSSAFTFKKSMAPARSSSDVRAPLSFADAAHLFLIRRPWVQLSLVTMAASMHRYISDTDKESLPPGLTSQTFELQAKRMLTLFELHKSLSTSEREAQFFANPDREYKVSEVSPCAEFSRFKVHRVVENYVRVYLPSSWVGNLPSRTRKSDRGKGIGRIKIYVARPGFKEPSLVAVDVGTGVLLKAAILEVTVDGPETCLNVEWTWRWKLYQPDHGDEDKVAHSRSSHGKFYGVVAADSTWGRVLTSKESQDRALLKYPDARTFTSSTWAGVLSLWTADCEKNHHHSKLPESSPASSSASLPKVAKPVATRQPASPPTESDHKSTTRFTKPAANDRPLTEARPKLSAPQTTEEVAAMFEARFEAQDQPLLLYGVSGLNRIFQNRARALAALKERPEADLIFAHDEGTVMEFILTESARMRGEVHKSTK
ncbi:hypothetical protein B0H12DRAFT_1080374 [Mycena haematopus]|nr:hypothetical protein B0H12DRAFT_1080374 [Mycena haematopus]